MIEPASQLQNRVEYEQRIERLRGRMLEAGIGAVIVYSDECHFENLAYLCGYRPIFEMALLMVRSEGPCTLFTGYEGKTLAEREAEQCIIQPLGVLSAQGMLSDEPSDLSGALALHGLKPGDRVGIVGPRYFSANDLPEAASQHAVPAFITQAVAKAISSSDGIANVTPWLTQLPSGLRSKKSAREINLLEEAGRRASTGVLAMMKSIQPGMRERDLLGFAQSAAPSSLYSYPPVLHSGSERCNAGLFTPSDRIMSAGDPVVIYYSPSFEGYSGNSGRSGVLIKGPGPDSMISKDSLSKLFNATYSSYLWMIYNLQEGVKVRWLVENANQILSLNGLKAFYSPLHSTGLTEWENSFDLADDRLCLEPGHVVQVDFTVFDPEFALLPAKIEDGFAIADRSLRAELERLAPLSAQRIANRRQALKQLGITLHESVLPLSDLTGQFYPYLLSAEYQAL